MERYRDELTNTGVIVYMPVFDDFNGTELMLCSRNRSMLETADEVHIFWDGRSMGTVFDMGMAFAMRKPWKLVYLEPKTFVNVIRQHEMDSMIGGDDVGDRKHSGHKR